jgi:phage replication O-like protein O
MEALARTRFSGYERNVLDFLFRKTYGWSKKSDTISLSQFVDGTGITKPHIVRTINRLVQRNIIFKTVAQIGNDKPTTYEFNKHFGEWGALPKQATLPKQAPTITIVPVVSLSSSLSVEEKNVLEKEPLPKLATLPKRAMAPDVVEVLAYLNEKVKRNFKVPGEILARLKDYSVEDCKTVIDKKCREWIGTRFEKHLDPVTLFRPSNFDRYLNQTESLDGSLTLRQWVEKNPTFDFERFSDPYARADAFQRAVKEAKKDPRVRFADGDFEILRRATSIKTREAQEIIREAKR